MYEVFVVEDKIKVLDALGVIKTHEKNARVYVNKISDGLIVVQENKVSEKTKQEVKESGTKLQKLMLKILEEKDLKIAIDLWKYAISRAYYEDDKGSIFVGYFNLGYSYYKEDDRKKVINA